MTNGNYEVFAAHLLLTSPSDLIIRWAETKTRTDGNQVVEEELGRLPLSEGMKTFVKNITQSSWPARNAFRGIGQAVGNTLYSGSEPHPTVTEMEAIIKALGELSR